MMIRIARDRPILHPPHIWSRTWGNRTQVRHEPFNISYRFAISGPIHHGADVSRSEDALRDW